MTEKPLTFAQKLPDGTDGIILSFPRSGRHFTLAVISDYLLTTRNISFDGDHQDKLELLFPSNRQELQDREKILKLSSQISKLYIRTHNSRVPFKNRQIKNLKNVLILRNLYDATWSLFLKQDRGRSTPGSSAEAKRFLTFLNGPKGYQKIIRYYDMLSRSLETGSWCIIQYEQATKQPFTVFKRVIEHLFDECQSSALEAAIESNTIERMRQESLKRALDTDPNLELSPDFRELGVRTGGTQNNKTQFSPELSVEFREHILQELKPAAAEFVQQYGLLEVK